MATARRTATKATASKAVSSSTSDGDKPAVARVFDFTNVKDRGQFNPKHKASGDYRAKVVKVVETKSQAGNQMWVYTITVSGDKTASYPYRVMFEENQLWKLRNLLIAAGLQVPQKRVKVDPAKVVGKEIGITLEDDEYDNKMKSVIEAVFPTSDLDSDEPADDDDTDVEDDDEVSEEDLDEMEVEDL